MLKKIMLLVVFTVSIVFSFTRDVFYVATDGSDDSTGLSRAKAWATVQHAKNIADTGDLVLICNDGRHLPTVTDSFNINSGSQFNPIIFRGAASDGTDNGTIATISGESLPAGNNLFYLNATDISIRFENLRIINGKNNNVYMDYSINTSSITFDNCYIDSAASSGTYNTESSSSCMIGFNNCSFEGNTGIAIEGITSRVSAHQVTGCYFGYNGGGISTGNSPPSNIIYDNNIFDNNTGDDIEIKVSTENTGIVISNSFFIGGAGDGISTADSVGNFRVFNCAFVDKGGYGNNFAVDLPNSPKTEYCLYYNNTLGNTTVNSGIPYGLGHVYTNPYIQSDFRWPVTSPLKGAGKKNVKY